MSVFLRRLHSTVGLKYLMAGSGVVLVGFVCGHLLGNLQFFLPPRAINRYAHFLQSNPELLWLVRLTLLALLVIHVWTALRLRALNRAARPAPYAASTPPYGATLASRTMLLSGLMVAAFVVYHLLHFTVKVESLNGTPVAFHQLREPATGQPDVFAMMVAGFRVWPVSLFYAGGIALLCLHLSHGVAAMFQSLGLRTPTCAPLIQKLARVLAGVLLVGYLSIPAAVLLGRGETYLRQVVEHNAARLAGAPAAPPTAH